MTPPGTHKPTQTDYGPRLKEIHADNGGAGINNGIRGVRELWVGVGITAASPKLTNTIPNRQGMSKTKLP